MAADDDIATSVLEGDAYDLAAVTTRRTFAISLQRKIELAVAVLAVSILLGPALVARQDLIGSLEGAGPVSATLQLAIGLLALGGILTAFVVGVLLVGYCSRTARRSPSLEAARRLVRIEDVLMLFLLQATAFVLIPVSLSLVGVASPDAIRTLYAHGVVVYRPTPIAVDARSVSVLGGLLGLILAALRFGVIGRVRR
jgi:hypothetical protein